VSCVPAAREASDLAPGREVRSRAGQEEVLREPRFGVPGDPRQLRTAVGRRGRVVVDEEAREGGSYVDRASECGLGVCGRHRNRLADRLDLTAEGCHRPRETDANQGTERRLTRDRAIRSRDLLLRRAVQALAKMQELSAQRCFNSTISARTSVSPTFSPLWVIGSPQNTSSALRSKTLDVPSAAVFLTR